MKAIDHITPLGLVTAHLKPLDEAKKNFVLTISLASREGCLYRAKIGKNAIPCKLIPDTFAVMTHLIQHEPRAIQCPDDTVKIVFRVGGWTSMHPGGEVPITFAATLPRIDLTAARKRGREDAGREDGGRDDDH